MKNLLLKILRILIIVTKEHKSSSECLCCVVVMNENKSENHDNNSHRDCTMFKMCPFMDIVTQSNTACIIEMVCSAAFLS